MSSDGAGDDGGAGEARAARAPPPPLPALPLPAYGLHGARGEGFATAPHREANGRDDDATTRASDDATTARPTLTVHRRARRSQRSARTPARTRMKRFGLARLRPRRMKRPRAFERGAKRLARERDRGAEWLAGVGAVVGRATLGAVGEFKRASALGKVGFGLRALGGAAKAFGCAAASATLRCWAPKVHGVVTAVIVAAASTRRTGDASPIVRFVERKIPGPGGRACARALAAAPAKARGTLRRWATWQGVRLVMRVTARKQQRKIDYSMRVAPVIGSYLIAKRRIARIRDAEKRDEAWERQHQWGAERMRDVIEDFGGFYRKVGQIAGTAKQMMPAPYIECFSKTMDNNPPVSFREVRKTLEESLGGHLGEHFAELSRKPVATASIAQVHFGRLLDGREVAVKVQATDAAMMIGDIESMLQTTKAMRWLGLDEGLDFPTIFRAYLDVVDEEFDFTIEGAKTEEFGKLLDAAGLADRISVPQVIMSTRRVLIMRRVRGMKLLTLFNRARAQNKIPRCPTPVSKCHGAGGFGWQGVFHSMFTAWGVMMLKHGHFHTDPHPGNFMVANDGKLVLLDWGQTKRVSEVERMHMCRLSLYMANEDHVSIAREISEHGTVRLQRPTTEALSALAYAYFDTRPSPLAEMNVMDLKNSPFVQNKIVQNTQEGFFAIRSVFLLRGMLSTCGLRMSMVEAWEAIARNALVLNGEVPPSRFRLKTKLLVNRSLLGLQRRLNVGAGSRLNAVEDYMSNKEDEEDGASNGRSLWPSSSSLF